MKKKLCGPLCIFLSAVLLIGLLNFPADAAGGIVAGGGCGDNGNNVTWTLERSEQEQDKLTLTVSGTGNMYDYAAKEDVPWYSYRTQITAAAIGQGVTSVGQNAFRDCTALESVTLPTQGLKSVNNVAFYNCNALKEITLPEGVETIGESAFGYCALEKFSLPASVTEIGASVFYRCSALTAIEVKEGNANFSAKDGVLFDKVEPEDDGDSGDSGGSSDSGDSGGGDSGDSGGGQTVKDKSKLIWYPAAKAEAEYTVPDGVKTIGSYACHSALNLKTVTLPEGVEIIEPYAFAYSVLGTFNAPKSLKSIGEAAFYECKGLSSTDENNQILEVGVVNFAGSRQEWNALTIGDKNYCLTNAKIVFEDMNQDTIIASGECGNKGSNAKWSLNDKGQFIISGSEEMSSYQRASDAPWASYRKSGSEETEDLRGKIQTLTIESGITNVGDYAFCECANLTTVKLPSSAATIGAQAFSNCAKLTSVNLSATAATSIGDYAFNGTTELKGVTFPETLKTIGKRAFMRSGLTAVTIPIGVTSVGEWAFRWCGSLASFTMEPIPSNVTPHQSAAIGDYALADCAALVNADFTLNLGSLGEYAFANCAALTGSSDSLRQEEVWIPESVFNVGSCAFHGCAKVKAVNVDENNLTYCSESGNAKKGMLLNKDKTCIYYYPAGRAEDSCEIPESVGSVAPFAFDGAGNLKTVVYGGSQSQWDALLEIALPEEERTLVGPYNAPLRNATVTCLGIDPTDDDKLTKVTSQEIQTTEEGRQFEIVVHCGIETLGAQVLCAVYDADGRFLRMQEPLSDDETEAPQELKPGEDNALKFALDESMTETGQMRLLILDGENLPCCESVTPKLSADTPPEESPAE